MFAEALNIVVQFLGRVAGNMHQPGGGNGGLRSEESKTTTASLKLPVAFEPAPGRQEAGASELAREVSLLRSDIVNRLASGDLQVTSPARSGRSFNPAQQHGEAHMNHGAEVLEENVGGETHDVAVLRTALAEVKRDRTRLEHMLLRAEMQQLAESAAAETKHDREAHAVVEDLCEQLLHERIQRLRCLEIVRDLCSSLRAEDSEMAETCEFRSGGEWDQALGRARCVLQDACDEWDAARGAGGDGMVGAWSSEDAGSGSGHRGKRGAETPFADSLAGEVGSEARHGKLVQVLRVSPSHPE